MTHPIKLINDAMEAKLIAATLVSTLVGSRVFVQEAEPGSGLPYIVLQYIAGGFTNTSPRDDTNVMYQVVGWGLSKVQAYEIANAIHETLHRSELLLSGWSNYRLAGQRWFEQISWAEGNKVYGVGEEFGIWSDKAN